MAILRKKDKKTGTKEKKDKKEKKERKKLNIKIKIAIVVVLLLPIFLSLATRNPEGTSIKSPYFGTGQLEFLYDLTYVASGDEEEEAPQTEDTEGDGEETTEPPKEMLRDQNILNAELSMIANAQEFILMDMFLFNDAYDRENSDEFPKVVQVITDALIKKKQAQPDIKIIFITDPINSFYGAYEEKHQKKLKEAGITVVETDLSKMKDSNFLYSGYYRLLVKPFGTEGFKWILNPFDYTKNKVNVRSVLALANFKANHRKLLITEQGAMVLSANAHDASSYHSNVGVMVSGPVVQHLIEAERTVAAFSGKKLPALHYTVDNVTEIPKARVRALTEKEIANALKARINASKQEETIQIGIFYISDSGILKALKKAAERGVIIQIVADPNKDAFGREKDGSPNRPILTSLVAKYPSIEVRWYDTHGEQYHSKIAFFSGEKQDVTILGSGNYTRRNLGGYNLECDLEIVTPKNSPFSLQVTDYFDRIWTNRDGQFTADFEKYQDTSSIKKLLTTIQEPLGLCTF